MRWPRLMSSAYLAFSFHAREKLVQELHECRLERCPPRPVPALGHHFAQTVKEVAEQLNLPWISAGRLFVADRANNRIQIFDQDGNFLAEWKQFGRPSGVYIRDDIIYVADSQSDEKTNPPFRQGIRIGSVKDGKVVRLSCPKWTRSWQCQKALPLIRTATYSAASPRTWTSRSSPPRIRDVPACHHGATSAVTAAANRMPLGQSQDIPQTDPRGMATPRF